MFDRVHYGKLFDVLMERNIICRQCSYGYSLLDTWVPGSYLKLNQRICAEWGACRPKSDFFQATNGVKQGSIISPILFTVSLC